MTNIKRALLALSVVLSVFMIMPAQAVSAANKASGMCGANVSWTLSNEGVLTISGTGEISSNSWYNYRQDIKNVVIPKGITSIKGAAFYECSKITSITIPDSVTYIGEAAFMRCSELTSITIPDSVTYIGDEAFDECSNLTSVTIPNSVTYIGEAAFLKCSKITSITIPDSVTSIEDWCFYHCDGLTSITIPNSVTSIGQSAFYMCENLNSVSIPDSVTSIDGGAFAFCYNLTNVNIPNSVTSIGVYVFYQCFSLESIVIPNSVTSIGDNVFTKEGMAKYEKELVIYTDNTLIQEYAIAYNISYKAHYLEKTEAVAATTTSAGNSEYYTCSLCGKYFSNAEATNEIAENSWIIAQIALVASENPSTITDENPSINNDTSPSTDDGKIISGIQSVSLNKETFTYTGKAIKATVIVTDTNGSILSADNYDLTYSKSLKNVGTKSVTITFKGNYSGSKTLRYNVIPKNASKLKVKKNSKSINVSWKKQSKQTSGYQIEFSTKKSFKNAKSITVKNTKKTCTTINNIKSAKKYYVRIRTYKKVASKKYYSTWSKTKSVK